ncbi:kinase-like domain-containing protein [Spinellus fusiger]|nr:kinase-like domain-containing protein [Spinellus fusiger]
MMLQEIGRGVHGKVKLAQNTTTGHCVAIKIVDKHNRRRQLGYSLQSEHIYRESEQKVRREIAILKKCVHPHVVRLLEVMDDPASRKIYMVLEYMRGGEILWRNKDEPRLSVDRVRSIFRDVVSGLDYLHYQGIIHRDIKPANLLLTQDQVVKISDFGVSYFNQHLAGDVGTDTRPMDRELAETAGTPAFFAPELCSVDIEGHQEHPEQRITKAIDVWALGVTLYCLLLGQCPFIAATEFELFDIIPREPLSFPDSFIDEQAKLLLEGLLDKNPKTQMTLEQVHPWVIQDLRDPSAWWKIADPRQYKTVKITKDEVDKAVTIMGRLKNTLHKVSNSFTFFTHPFTQRSSVSVCHSEPFPSPSFSFPSSSPPPPLPPLPNHSHPFLSHAPDNDCVYTNHFPLSSQLSEEDQEIQEVWLEVPSDHIPDHNTPSPSSSSDLTIQFS